MRVCPIALVLNFREKKQLQTVRNRYGNMLKQISVCIDAVIEYTTRMLYSVENTLQ